MTRKIPNPHRTVPTVVDSTARVDNTHKQQLSFYVPQSRRKNSPRRNLASPTIMRSRTSEIPTVDHSEAGTGNGGHEEEEEEEGETDDVDDDNICLVCVAKCVCGKTDQRPISIKRESLVSIADSHFSRQRIILDLSSPSPPDQSTPQPLPIKRRRGRPPKNQSLPQSTPIKLESNNHSYSTRSHANVIVRDGRGRGKNGIEKVKKLPVPSSDIAMDISDIELDDEEEEEEDSDDSEDESDDLGDSGDDVDIEEEEERAIIAEESRRLRAYSEDDDADEEDDELDEEEDIFQERRYSSSESSPDEDHEFYQNDLYLEAAFCRPADSRWTNGSSNPRRGSNESHLALYDNPALRTLIEEQGLASTHGKDTWHDSDEDRVGWECFIDDTDVEMGEDFIHLDDESMRIGGGDTTDEEDFKLLGPPPVPAKDASPKKKSKKANTEVVATIITTAHQPPPLATWERDGDELTIIDALPAAQSPLPSPLPAAQTPPAASPILPSMDDFFDASLLSTHTENGSLSDASASSDYTITGTGTTRSRKDSTTTATSFNTDSFTTPANRGRGRKVPLGSYRRKVMLGERSLEAQEKSVFLKEWYTLQERRNLRKMSKSRTGEILDISTFPQRGRRREKLRIAQRARRDHDASAELDMQFIKRRRMSDVQGNGSSTAAFMERLGLDLGGDMSEEEDYDDDEFDNEGRVVNEVGEQMILDDDLELAQFIVPPPGGIDLSPLFGAVDA
jgi:hypothetical protein